MALRVKTTWFKQIGGPRDMAQQASVIASMIWRLADLTIANVSRADFDILTPERGYTLLGELSVFMLHLADRMVYRHVDESGRQALVQHTAIRLAEILQENIDETLPGNQHDYKPDFIDLVNRRTDEYASYDFPPEEPDFSVLRCLANHIRDRMEGHDKPWIIDQIMEIEAPHFIETLARTVRGLFPASDLPPAGNAPATP